MKPIWHIDGNDVIRLQGDSPAFVRFMNALLASHAQVGGVPGKDVRLTIKDNAGDGGVDAAIGQAAVPGRDRTGYMNVPTCWQYKAQPTGNIKADGPGGQEAALRSEVGKPHARALIEDGYGYRFCIADDPPDQTKSKWEKWLNEEVKTFNPDAPPVRVITASQLASWVNEYPAIVAGQFRTQLTLDTLSVWHHNFQSLTREFVPAATWPGQAAEIRRHVNFSNPVTAPLTVQGEAGAGKSRGVCEALLGDASRGALVAVTDDQDTALNFARDVSRTPGAQAILVADECGLEHRERIAKLLPACSDRFRVITIDNDLQRAGGAGELRFEHLPTKTVEQILAANFPTVAPDRRRAWANASGGFVRLAVDLCEFDPDIPADGLAEFELHVFHDRYLRLRLKGAELDAVAAIALLPRVGYRDDVKAELEAVCSLPLVGLSAAEVIKAAGRLRHAPGFIAFAGRYLYVTPNLIAQVAFRAGWSQWVAPDPAAFLAALPATLVEAFIQRVQGLGNGEMREAVAHFFLDWARALGPPALGSEPAVARLARLVEMDAATYLPLLKKLLFDTPPGELCRLHLADYAASQARRALVWLAEKLALLPESFADAEAMLLRFACEETEDGLGNNATGVWTSLFRPMLSGTPVPFNERLALLEQRSRELAVKHLPLALAAVGVAMETRGGARLAAPPIVFGRVPPPQWQPATMNDLRACQQAALAMAARLTAGGGALAPGIRSLIVRRLSPLLLADFFEAVRDIVGPPPLPDALLAELTREIEEFLDVFGREHHTAVHRPAAAPGGAQPTSQAKTYQNVVPPDLAGRLTDWRQSLVADGLHSRLVELVGQEFWRQQWRGDAAAWQAAVADLAAELIRSPADFERELGWLSSPDARSAYRFGQLLAQADSECMLLDRMVGDIPRRGGTVLVRGYIDHAASARPDLLPRINALLDRLQADDPKVAYEVLWSAGADVRKVDRLFEMVDQGGLPAEFLLALEHAARGRELSDAQLSGAVYRLATAAESGDAKAAAGAVRMLHGWLHPNRQSNDADQPPAHAQALALLPRVLRLAYTHSARSADLWVQLALDWTDADPDAACRMLAGALDDSDYNTRTLALNGLIRLADRHPSAVMESVGAATLNPMTAGRIGMTDLSSLFIALPLETVQAWLNRTGAPGARHLARHLPPPEISAAGRPTVPPLTEMVLAKFEDDDKVFREFSAGTRSGQAYHGDIAAAHEQEAAVARQFLTHPLKRVRDWAVIEIQSANRQAAMWRQMDEEAATF